MVSLLEKVLNCCIHRSLAIDFHSPQYLTFVFDIDGLSNYKDALNFVENYLQKKNGLSLGKDLFSLIIKQDKSFRVAIPPMHIAAIQSSMSYIENLITLLKGESEISSRKIQSEQK